MAHTMMVPPAVIAMQNELKYHPGLLDALSSDDAVKSFEDGLAIIAAYAGIVLDGVYQAHEIEDLCGKIVHRLRDKRGAIAIITTGSV